MKHFAKRGFSLLLVLVMLVGLFTGVTVTASAGGTYTVTYDDCGTLTTETCDVGSSVTLPASASTYEGYTFAGWVADAIGIETSAAPTVLTGSYTPTADVTLYACYTRSETSSGSGGAATIATWTGAFAANSAVSATTGTGTATSTVGFTGTGYGNNTYLKTSMVSGSSVTFAGLNLSGYSDITMTFYTGGTAAVVKSSNNSHWSTNVGTMSNGSLAGKKEKTNILVTITDIPAAATSLVLTYTSGTTGNLAFGGVTISGTATAGTVTYYTTAPVTADPGVDYTVSFSVPTGVAAVSAMTCNSNGSITLPSANALTDHTFVGWVTAALEEDSATAPATVYTAGSSYTASGNVTLFALYSYSASGGSGTPGSFTLVTSNRDDWSGEYVLTNYNAARVLKTDAAASPGDAASSVILSGAGITHTGNTLTGVSNDYILVVEKITGSDTNYSFRLKGSAANKYLNTANSNSLGIATSATQTAAQWTISAAANGKATITSVAYTKRTIRCNSSTYQFRTYESGQGDVYLYAGSSTVTMYTTGPAAACEHANLSAASASAATCTAAGSTAYWYCADCGRYFSDAACQTQIAQSDTVIAATGHSYTGVVTTAATCTADGVRTYTCANCGDTYTEAIAMLGHAWDAGIQTVAPTETTAGVMTYTCARCGTTRREAIPALGVTQHYTRAGSITSGTDYVMAFHYTYNGADTWYMIGNVGSSTSAFTAIDAPVNNQISLAPGAAELWTIAAVDGEEDGYSLRYSSSGKYLSSTPNTTTISNSNTAVTWTAAADNDTNTFRFQMGTRAIGMMSGSSVRNYAISNENNSGTNYIFDIYLFANTCAHANTQLQGAYDATCTANGYTGDLVCLDCGAIVTPGTTILQGHNYVEVSRTQPTCTIAGNIHYECSRCDSVKDVAIEALGHNYEQTAHQGATCTADGYTTYTCLNCGDSYTDTIAATGHNYDPETGICAICGDQLASYTVSFAVPAGIDPIADITAFDGTVITLPEPTGTLLANAEDYVFLGWTASDVADSTNAAYTEVGSYTVTGSVTFKALYTWVDEATSFGNEGVYRLLTEDDLEDLDTGWMLIIANDGKWQSKTMALADYANSGNDKFLGANVTVSNNTITLSSASSVQQFTVVKDDESGNFYLISNYTDNEDNDYYLTSCTNTANANNITLTSNPTAAALWKITYHEDSTVKLTAQGSWTANTVQFNSSNYNGFFSCYGETYYGSENMPSNIYGIRLFASNPIYHFTTAPVQTCAHENVTWTDNGDGTCSCTCDDCGHTVVSNQAHAWTLNSNAAGTVAATCTESGKAGYVCDNCHVTKLETTEPLGHDYAGVQTLAPTCSAAGVMTYTCSRCGDSYTEAIPAIDHTFEDGTCTMCGAALYVLVTEAPENWEGEYLIVYVANDNAKVFDGKNDSASNYTVGTFYGEAGSESSLICVPNPDAYTVYFEPTTNGYNIMNSNADWWSYTSNKNGFSVNTNTAYAGTYTITLDANGNAAIKNAGNLTIKFNTAAAASGGDRFRFYGTSVYTTIKLYEKYDTCHHNWVLDGNASTAATCTAAGNNVYVCSICGETKNETVAALGHDYLYETVEPTCLAEGYTVCTCSRCDYEDIPDYSITAALGHDFSVLAEDEGHYIAPTCTEEGLAYYQCSRCDAFDEEGTVLEALGHDYVNGVCSRCGDELDAQTFTLMTSLNFANAGSVIMVIEVDGEAYALSEDADGKNLVAKPVTVANNTVSVYDDGTYAIVIPQTGLSDGSNTGYGFMTVNNEYLHVNSSSIRFANETANAALAITAAQVWNGEYDAQDNLVMVSVPNAYFLQGKATGNYISNYVSGYEESVFTYNNDSFYAVPVYFYASAYVPTVEPEPSEHNTIYVEGTPATCTESGFMSYYMCIDQDCDAAGKMFADIYCTQELTDITIPALGHTYLWDGTPGDGEHLLECTRCGDVILETCDTAGDNGACSVCGYLAAQTQALKIDSAALVLNGKIDVTYFVTVPTGYSNPYMVFTFNGADTTVTDCTADGGYLKFTFTGINPQCMGDNISATLYATKSGAEQSVTMSSYSVRQYCVNKLADNTISAELRALLSDMLAYGAAAQTFMSYNMNAIVTEGNDINNPTYRTFTNLSDYAASFDGTADEELFWISARLTLTDSAAMAFRFHADSVGGLTVNVSINGKESIFTEFTSIGNGVYEVSFNGISAEEFGDTVRATFERDSDQVGNELSYSVYAYVQSKQNDSSSALQALVKALYNYGASAAAYAN
ncbi:MAG: InlB B-repeat-containing protein [Oscillospiraceae bacterium]|nr:InlB B-repeat-containing protein [Oscillospiraceae bacterium]